MLDQPDPKLVKVGVRNRGCSGLAYHLEYVDKPGAFDESVEQDGVKVLIDSKALFSIIGSEMDWVEDKLSQRFVFRNPNISELFPISISPRLAVGHILVCQDLDRLFMLCVGIDLVWLDVLLTCAKTEEQCGCGESFMV